MEIKELKSDGDNPLFDRGEMFHKQFNSDQRQIRYYAMLVIQKAPIQLREINLLEQQICELLKNAVKHGNKLDPKKKVDVWYRFSDDEAYLIVEDEGDGFQNLEEWNIFNRKRLECIHERRFDELDDYVSFRTKESDVNDGGNALFAAMEYWNIGMVYNSKRNGVAVGRRFEKNRFNLS